MLCAPFLQRAKDELREVTLGELRDERTRSEATKSWVLRHNLF